MPCLTQSIARRSDYLEIDLARRCKSGRHHSIWALQGSKRKAVLQDSQTSMKQPVGGDDEVRSGERSGGPLPSSAVVVCDASAPGWPIRSADANFAKLVNLAADTLPGRSLAGMVHPAPRLRDAEGEDQQKSIHRIAYQPSAITLFADHGRAPEHDNSYREGQCPAGCMPIQFPCTNAPRRPQWASQHRFQGGARQVPV